MYINADTSEQGSEPHLSRGLHRTGVGLLSSSGGHDEVKARIVVGICELRCELPVNEGSKNLRLKKRQQERKMGFRVIAEKRHGVEDALLIVACEWVGQYFFTCWRI
jgi:hypothetical protein